MRPAWRINSICSFDFSVIAILSKPLLQALKQVPGDLLDRLVPVHLAKQAPLTIVFNNRLGLLKVDLQPPGSRLSSVIIALVQLAAVKVADPFYLRRRELHVVDMA